MSLESPSGAAIRNIPGERQNEYSYELQALRQHFPNAEIEILRELSGFVDERIREHGWTRKAGFCSSWIPGSNWEEGSGVYQPIFETMVTLFVDHELAHKRAGWFFGLILMDVMIHRNEDWEFKREPRRPDDDPEGFYYYPIIR